MTLKIDFLLKIAKLLHGIGWHMHGFCTEVCCTNCTGCCTIVDCGCGGGGGAAVVVCGTTEIRVGGCCTTC